MEELQRKSELSQSKEWKEIRNNQIEMIIKYSTFSTYEASDIKAMLRLIAKTDEWQNEYDKFIKNKKKGIN